jgi:hypothetical protein
MVTIADRGTTAALATTGGLGATSEARAVLDAKRLRFAVKRGREAAFVFLGSCAAACRLLVFSNFQPRPPEEAS